MDREKIKNSANPRVEYILQSITGELIANLKNPVIHTEISPISDNTETTSDDEVPFIDIFDDPIETLFNV